MIRTLVGAALVALALTGCAAQAPPLPTPTSNITAEERFWLELIDYPELFELRTDTLELAESTCSALDRGVSWDALMGSVTGANADTIVAVAEAAVVAFCPEHLDKTGIR